MTTEGALKEFRIRILENPDNIEEILKEIIEAADQSPEAVNASYGLRSIWVELLWGRRDYSECLKLFNEMKSIAGNNKVADSLLAGKERLNILLDLKLNASFGQSGTPSEPTLNYLTTIEGFSSMCEDLSEYYAEHGNFEVAFRFWDVYTRAFSVSLLLTKFRWTHSTIPLVSLHLPEWMQGYYSGSTEKEKKHITERILKLCEETLDHPSLVNLPLKPTILVNVYEELSLKTRKRKMKTLEKVILMIEEKKKHFEDIPES